MGTNVVVTQLSRLEGELDLNGAAPVTGANIGLTLPSLGLYRSFDLFGRSANLTLGVPYGTGEAMGTVAGVPRKASLNGFLDSSLRLSVNLLGGDAMKAREFARWRQDVLLGVSVKLIAPTGEYDPTRLINLGSNRWAFKVELGYSQRFGHWIIDAYGGGWFYTTNPEFFSRNVFYPGTRSREQAPVGSFEGHLSYDVRPRLWVSLDANYWWGGRASINGIEDPRTELKSSRVGVTASVPLTAHQSVKLSLSDGTIARYGGKYRAASLAWQYAWID